VDEALKNYASDRLQVLEQIPELLRSVVGEAGQYTLENRRALGRGITQLIAMQLAISQPRSSVNTLQLRLPTEKLASLLNAMLFGYLVMELTSEFPRTLGYREDFLESLGTLFLHGAVSPLAESSSSAIGLNRNRPPRTPLSRGEQRRGSRGYGAESGRFTSASSSLNSATS
jgi:hypothetical protein